MNDLPSTTQSRNIGDATVFEDADALQSTYYKQSWIVTIGIDYVGTDHPRLVNARNDAEAFAQLLHDHYGFQEPIRLFDAEARKDAILDLLERLAKQVGPDDRLLIFFAGHGTTRISDTGFREGYIIPHDGKAGKYYSYIEMEDVRKACEWIPAKHILIILDCCFSGIAAVTSRSTIQEGPSTISNAYLTRITKRSARQIMTAGASDEVVADSGSRPGHSAFTGALLAGLEGLADQNNDGIITASDLASFIKPLVTRETARAGSEGQTPFFNYLAGSGEGDVVFLRPDTPIIVQKGTPSPIPPPSIRSNFWLAMIGVILIVMVVLGWLAFRPRPEPVDPEVMYKSVIASITAEAASTATVQAAVAESAVDKPAPTQTAIAAAQTQEAQTRETVVAATIAVLAATLYTPTPTEGLAPAPIAVITPTPTLSPPATFTPDLTGAQVAAQATSDASTAATRQAQRTVAARATATSIALALNGPISWAGATTMRDLTEGVLADYRSGGYLPTVQAAYAGTRSGFVDYFCSADLLWDIALATGENRDAEYAAQCGAVGRVPIGFQVGLGKVDVGSANERYEPLYLYTTEEILRHKPQVEAFIRYYLIHANDVLRRFGSDYAPASAGTLEQGLKTLDEILRS